MSQQDTVDLTELAALQQTILGGGGLLPLVGSADTLGVPGNSEGQDLYTVRKPWIDPPDGSIPIDVQFGIALPGLGFGLIEVVSFRVPEGFDAVINGYNTNFTGGGFVNFSGEIIWQMQIDGRPVEGLEIIQNQRGTVEFPRKVSPFRVKTGQLLQFFVNHVANVALNGQTICGFWGYRYPRLTGQ
jgi:hypothetical protein